MTTINPEYTKTRPGTKYYDETRSTVLGRNKHERTLTTKGIAYYDDTRHRVL